MGEKLLHLRHLSLPADEARQLGGQVMGKRFQGAQGREVGREGGVEQLEDALRLLQIFEPVGAQVAQAGSRRQPVPHLVGGRFREQHLTAVGHGA
jgi:hypothetical protein